MSHANSGFYVHAYIYIYNIWIVGKHIQPFHLNLIARCAHPNIKIVSESAPKMRTMWGDSIENVSE